MIKRRPQITTPYLPWALEAIDKNDFQRAQDIIHDGARDYFGRIRQATLSMPVQDAPLLICLYRHMAAELERADPTAAALAETLKRIKLPPIEHGRHK